MHTRKLQSVGGGTYTVSLPKEWVASHGLDAGDPVDLHVRADGTIGLEPPDGEVDRPTEAVFGELATGTGELGRTIRAAYDAGATAIRLSGSESDATARRRAVDQAVEPLSGVSVVENDGDVVVRVLLDSDQVSVPQAVRQLAFVTLSCQQDASEALRADTSPNPPDRRRQPQRLRAMVDRGFATALDRLDELEALGLGRPALFELRETARHLEAVTARSNRIVRLAAETDEPLPEPTGPELRQLLDSSRDLVEQSVDLVLEDETVASAQDAMREAATIRNEARSIEEDLGEGEVEAVAGVRLVADEIRRLADSGGAIARIGLQKAVREGAFTERPQQEA